FRGSARARKKIRGAYNGSVGVGGDDISVRERIRADREKRGRRGLKLHRRSSARDTVIRHDHRDRAAASIRGRDHVDLSGANEIDVGRLAAYTHGDTVELLRQLVTREIG